MTAESGGFPDGPGHCPVRATEMKNQYGGTFAAAFPPLGHRECPLTMQED